MTVRVRLIGGILTFTFISLFWLGGTSASAGQDVPSNAHRSAMGRGWECDRGYVRTGNECRPVIIPSNASLDYYGHGWECKRGFARVGDECVTVMVPANAKLDYYGHGWECNKGYVRVQNENECVAVIVPANARLDYYGHGWECNKGYVRVHNKNECVAVMVPANARLDYYGHGWECNKGYVRVQSECATVVIPANAKLDYYGHGWECSKGYRRTGNECEPVIVPENASLDYYGHAWVCNKGYRRFGNECLSATTSALGLAVSAARPKTEAFRTVPLPSPSSIDTTITSAAPDRPLTPPNDRAAAADAPVTAATGNSADPQVTMPNDLLERRPSPQGIPSVERSPRPASQVASNSVNARQIRRAPPVTPAAKSTDGADNSLAILVGIFLVFGLLRLTRVVRP